MKKYIRGKSMRDIAAEVNEWRLDFLTNEYKLNVTWINLLGTVDHPKPFHIWTGKRLATEDIVIPADIFDSKWEQHDSIKSVEASAKLARSAKIPDTPPSAA